MKNLVISAALVALSLSTQVRADGFKCTAEDSDLNVKVFNHTDPSEGTRVAAVMVVSDGSVGAGNKTIARFTDVNGTLDNKGTHYTAKVDLRFNDSGRKGELIGGTKLGQLKEINLNVLFTYEDPLAEGDTVGGVLYLDKRDGDLITIDLICERYLKN